eukprot:TRINITY_DN1523_c1_g2_i1.p1 TRINITY_DN1523_c1_g2~~TRINITY_DN1523_c1_g2_i1.p1  ORF type:complete len:492 (-),score=62.20 TRINITY_DN1523_c1_g2_i1:276-1718(-)
MGSLLVDRPHLVCIPYPAQGHVNPMMRLAKFLHSRGFYITFVNTEFNHQRLLRFRGPESMKGLDDFRFETIPDGLPPSDHDGTQDIPALCDSTSKNCAVPLRKLIDKLNDPSSDAPRVSCIVGDGVMSFALRVGKELHLPAVVFWTTSACGFMCYLHYLQLAERGHFPLKDESCLIDGYLDTLIDWIPGMANIRLRDLPSFIRTTDPNDLMVNFLTNEAQSAFEASAIIFNTFDALEREVLDAIRAKLPSTYTIGPLHKLGYQIHDPQLNSIGSNLWKEDIECIEWLDKREPKSVVYVNYGSITVMTDHQLREFAWGLANSKHPFLWVIRPDLVKDDSAILPEEFITEIEGRGLLASWCPQEQVLSHRSVGGFLTHNGWNSTLESICEGVPMICWPFFAEQPTNCRYACDKWGIGMEIDNDVKRDGVEGLVRELMEGEKGKEMKKKTMELKERAEEAIGEGGSFHMNMEKLIKEVLNPRE